MFGVERLFLQHFWNILERSLGSAGCYVTVCKQQRQEVRVYLAKLGNIA